MSLTFVSVFWLLALFAAVFDACRPYWRRTQQMGPAAHAAIGAALTSIVAANLFIYNPYDWGEDRGRALVWAVSVWQAHILFLGAMYGGIAIWLGRRPTNTTLLVLLVANVLCVFLAALVPDPVSLQKILEFGALSAVGGLAFVCLRTVDDRQVKTRRGIGSW